MAEDTGKELPHQSEILIGARKLPDGSYDTSRAVRVVANPIKDDSEKNAEGKRKVGGVTSLADRLAIALPDLTEEERSQEWIRQRRESLTELDLGDEIPGIAKTPYVDSNVPDIIIKKYDGVHPDKAIDEDKKSFARARSFIPPGFLADTRFVALSDSEASALYQIQDRLEGFRFKSNMSASLNRYAELRALDPSFEQKIKDDPSGWIDMQRDILKKTLGEIRWNNARSQIARLIPYLQQLEADNLRLRDVDFFIDPQGNVTLFDFAVLDITEPTERADSDEDNAWRGWDVELNTMFQVQDK